MDFPTHEQQNGVKDARMTSVERERSSGVKKSPRADECSFFCKLSRFMKHSPFAASIEVKKRGTFK